MAADETYRKQIRETFQAFSDEALRFQSARIIGGIDREECDREIARRAAQPKVWGYDFNASESVESNGMWS